MAAHTAHTGESYVAPRTPVETRVAELWARLLEVEKVGIHDDFFELGGHSLLAVELLAGLRNEFESDLPLAILFQAPTVAELAQHLQPDSSEPQWSSLVTIRPEGDKTPLFCLHGIYGDVLFYREFAKDIAEGHPVYALQPMTLNGERLTHKRVEDLAAYYIELMKTVQPKGPYFICGYSFGGTAALEIAQQLRRQGEEVALLAIFDTIVGAEWANPFAHTENFGRARRMGATGVSGLQALRIRLRKSYTAWRLYMMIKGVYINFRGNRHDLYMKQGHILPRKYRSDYTAWALRQLTPHYKPKPYAGDIVLFCSQKRKPKVTRIWSKIARGDLKTLDVPGDHLFLFEAESAKFLAEQVSHHFEMRECQLAAE
jgi:surfactin synthase thioesterase subunit/acyl carrier protein